MTKIKCYLPPKVSQSDFTLASLCTLSAGWIPQLPIYHSPAQFWLACLPSCCGMLLSGWDLTFLRLQVDNIFRTVLGTQLFLVTALYMSGQVYGWADLVQGQESENHQTESNHVELPRINLSWVCAHMFQVPWAKIKGRTNSTKSLWPLRFCFLQK